MINFGHETEELEFKKSTSEMHDAMKDIVAIDSSECKILAIIIQEISGNVNR